MRKYLFILLLCFISNLNAQSYEFDESVNMESIIFKAKLFTLSQHGNNSKEELIRLINNIPFEVFGKHDLIFIKISSRYFCQNSEYQFTVNWCDCDYYIAYSIKKEIYYLLGGFKTNDVREFSKTYLHSKMYFDFTYDISNKKLNDFLKNLGNKKIKKAEKCFDKCIETWEE